MIQKVRRHGPPAPRRRIPLRLLVGIRFQVCFTPLVGVLFTFPSRYLFTIGHRGVLRLGGWSPHVRTGFPVPRPTRVPPADCPYGAVTLFGRTFQSVPVHRPAAAGLVRVRSPLLAESRLMSFPPANEMVQFAGFASPPYVFRRRYRGCGGLPHSEIHDSQVARTSSWLVAACYVLHRLSVPRHPPNALVRLIQLREIPRTQAQTRAREPRKDTRSLAPSPERRSQRRTRSRRDSHNLFTMSNNESDDS